MPVCPSRQDPTVLHKMQANFIAVLLQKLKSLVTSNQFSNYSTSINVYFFLNNSNTGQSESIQTLNMKWTYRNE